VAIGLGSSEILWLIKKNKKTSRLKQKAFGTNVPGGLIKYSDQTILPNLAYNTTLSGCVQRL